MPAQQQASGAIHCWLQAPNDSVRYFGTCEKMPGDARNPEYEMLMNDATGTKHPLDLAWEGLSAQISLVMTRVDQNVVELLQRQPGPNIEAVAGAWNLFDYGSLMSLEGLTWQCWLGYTFGSAIGNKAVYVLNGMRPGRHYVQCVLWAPQSDETGTAPMKQHFLLYAWPKAIVNGTNSLAVLYNYDFSAINVATIK